MTFNRPKWHQEYRQKNKEQLNEYDRNWKKEHPNYHHEWYLKNKEKILQKNKQWKEENHLKYRKQQSQYFKKPEIIKRHNEYYKKARKKNPDQYRAYQNKFYQNNKESEYLRHKEYRLNNKNREKVYNINYRARKANAEGSHTAQEWLDLLNKTNGICPTCKQDVGIEKLTQDHIIPLSKNGSNYISNIRPLCKPCNSSKHNSLNWSGFNGS